MILTLTPPFHKDDYSLLGSCNGLICFNQSICLYHHGPACVFNPITREYVILPKCEDMYWWTGFGYLHTTNEYKVVRIYESGGDSNVGIIQVYTLGSGNGWRNAGTMDVNMKYVEIGVGAFANETLHWVNIEGISILAFHLSDEKYSELPPPPPYLTRDDVPYLSIKLGVLGDLLSAAYYYEDADNCDIWLLKKDGDNIDFSWIKEFSLVTAGVSFELTKNGKLLYYELTDICSYDPKVSSANMSASFGKYISSAILHKNTLVSLKALGEQDTKTMEFSLRERSSEVMESSATAYPQKHQCEV
ncbi:F-box protein At3g07870-like [Papaver somniferum]|uniref:F-box protein At3g07870-like n=1 Tax=Papaver somniferum TaxID=3469 RepID=UPI000E6FF094|nr:F-box protein At3g07870-like [Papaver somniferum]